MADQVTGQPPRGVAWRIVATAVAIVAAALLAIWLVFLFVGEERERERQDWQVRLQIVADSRLADVREWLAGEQGTVAELAENEALRLYLTRIHLREEGADEPDSPETQYLGNLLLATAERAGYAGAGPRVPANVERPGAGGLAIVGVRDGQVIVAAGDFPRLEGDLRAFVAGLSGRAGVLDLHRGPSGRMAMGFAAPVLAIQGEEAIGYVVGVKPVEDELFPLLKQPGSTEETAETVLVRRAGSVVEYLSPLAGGNAPLELKLATDTPELAAAWALENPNGFAARRDYRGREVLAVSRAVETGVPWVLLRKVDAAEALGPAEGRLQRLLIILLLAVAAAIAALLATWRHGASRRATAAAEMFRRMAERFEHQSRFLRVLTDSQPNAVTLVDAANAYRFVNAEAARRAGVSQEEAVGQPLASLLGPERARRYERMNREALEEGQIVIDLHRFEDGREPAVVRSQHIPIAETPDVPRGVLLVEEDLTAAITERERREKMLRQLVDTLTGVVDRRDPHAAHHSARVAAVSRALAEEMELSPVDRDTVGFAGDLMNLGKILVPEAILTKAGRLTEEEMQQVRDSIHASADLIAGVDFDGPVVDTLRQSLERWDGNGPGGLKGDQILVTARIVAVANAFVAMTSARAHRPGLGFDQALDALMADAGKAYDRRVVAALVSVLDNRGGRERWADFGTASA